MRRALVTAAMLVSFSGCQNTQPSVDSGTDALDGSGGYTGGGGALGSGGAPASEPNVKLTQRMQLIDGFGLSNAWRSRPPIAFRSQIYDAWFSITKGAGLSLLRTRIPFRESPINDDRFMNKNADGTYKLTENPDGTKTFSLNWLANELSNTSLLISDIQAKGADYEVTTFLSTPWSPPNNSVSRWKLSSPSKVIDYENAPEQGGYLDPNHYADYADVLADYILGFEANMGVAPTALSVQNEPNFQCDYESADWTAAQLHDFTAVLNEELTKKGVFARYPNLQIVAPEYQNVKEELVLPTLADVSTASVLSIVAVHQYELGPWNAGSYAPPPLAASLNAGKRIWMTEWSTDAWADDTGIADGLVVAKAVHQDLVVANMSAFFYWWSWGENNGALIVADTTRLIVPKRLYAIGQYSRFVRPGWYRVATTSNPAAGVLLSAFADASGANVAVVAINTGSSTVSLPLTLDAGTFGPVTQYRTSASEDMVNVGVLVGGATVNVALVPSSVTTFVAAVTH